MLTAAYGLILLIASRLAGPAIRPQDTGSKVIDCGVASKGFTGDRATAAEMIRAGDTAGALHMLEQASAICPGDYQNGVDLANLEMTAGENNAADSLINGLLKQTDTAELHEMLGTIQAKQENVKGAAEQFQIAARMEPSEDYVFAFGTALMKVNFGAASDVLRFGLEKYPSSIKMHVAMALALYAQDRTDEGAKLLCEAARLAPADVHPMEVLSDTGIVPPSLQAEVEGHLADLHRRYPRDGAILFDYAMVKAGRWSGSEAPASPELVSQLHAALTLDPHMEKAYFALSAIDDQRKDFQGEIAALKSAICIDPNVDQYHFRLAFAYRQAGDLSSFKDELARYRELHGKRPGN